MLQARPEPIAKLLADPDMPTAIAEYSATSLPGLDAPAPDLKAYADECGKTLFAVVAREADGTLAGFAVLRVVRSHHHTRPMGTTESLFARPGHPAAGRALLDAVCALAAELGLQGVGVSLPINDRHEARRRSMRASGFAPIHEIYFKPCKT